MQKRTRIVNHLAGKIRGSDTYHFEPKQYKHMIPGNFTELNPNKIICDNERGIWEREEYVNRCGHYGIVGI